MESKCRVFISVKSADLRYARRVHEFLTSHGVESFLSDLSLRESGTADYRKVIDSALESAEHLVVVGSSRANIESTWVSSEWGAFVNEKRAGRKTGNVITLLARGLGTSDLPISLRSYQVLRLGRNGLNELLHYVGERHPDPSTWGERILMALGRRKLLVAVLAILGLGLILGSRLGLWRLTGAGRSIVSLGAPKTNRGSAPPRAGEVRVFGPSRMEFVYVPGGWFTMGSDVFPRKYILDERPQRQVYVSGFWIGKYEVTNRQFAHFVDTQSYAKATEWRKHRRQGDEELPATWVTWDDARAYCDWAEYRLPSEAEWEKAARGTDGRVYPWGNEWDVRTKPRCNFADCNTDFQWRDKRADDGFGTIAPAGSFPEGASPYGAMDIAGNVQEWCNDWFGNGYYSRSPDRDPGGPLSGRFKVVRGGSCGSGLDHLACSARGMQLPLEARDDTGFRAAR